MNSLFEFINYSNYGLLTAFCTSLLLSSLVVLTKRWHGSLTLDLHEGVQKIHTSPTPRIGGVPIYVSLVLVSFNVSDDIAKIFVPILVASLPAFIFGLAEDISKRVSVLARLLATMASGLLAWYLTGYSLTRLDISFADELLKWLPISVLFTAFAVGGIANAINIIDGFNGLAATSSSIAFIGLGLIAIKVGDPALALASFLLAASILGFLLINWPFGKIFLGDGGAYLIGFCLGWMSVLLAQRHALVTAFVALLVCIHPVTEVVFSVFRRHIRKLHPGHPDRLHLHSLIKSRFVNQKFSYLGNTSRNSITGLIVGLFTLFPVLIAQIVFVSTGWALIFVVFFVLIYIVIYSRLVHFKWYSPFRFS